MKYRSKWIKRTVTVLGDEDGFRFFSFDDGDGIITQHPIEEWDEIFELVK